jgi:hypothetical protein
MHFHFLLQQVRSFFQQTNIHGSVANQVTMPAETPESLKEHVLIAASTFGRRRGPEALQRDSCALQFASGEVNGKERQHQVKAVGVAPQQDEVVVVS